MARDTAAATFAARTLIVAMDRPSVERELRHAHGDTTRYTTAHAARDALAAARADTPITTPPAPPAPPTHVTTATASTSRDNDSVHQVQATYSGQRMYVTFTVGLDLKMRVELQAEPVDLSARNVDRLLRRIAEDPSLTDITVDGQPHTTTPAAATAERATRDDATERTPPGGCTEADRVRPAQPRDTSSYRSVRQFPAGIALTVHAIGEDGPGRQLGHGVVVDHPGPEHVTVESPYGTGRISPISHVRPADPHDPTRSDRAAAAPNPATPDRRGSAAAAAARREHLFRDTQPQILDDPHWPTLAAQLERIATTGADVAGLVDQVIAERTLPADNPARSLDYRLANAVPPVTSQRPGPDTDPPAVSRPAPPPPQHGQQRSGPSR